MGEEMTATQAEQIAALLARLHEEPGNRVLIGIIHDALLEADSEKEAVELECRCWLKAKGRKPYFSIHVDKYFFYAQGSNAEKNVLVTAISSILPEELTDAVSIQRDTSFEGAIQDTVNRWLKLSRERQDELWNWEPPS